MNSPKILVYFVNKGNFRFKPCCNFAEKYGVYRLFSRFRRVFKLFKLRLSQKCWFIHLSINFYGNLLHIISDQDRQNDIQYVESNEPVRVPYPRRVFLILGNELCERFTYYGMTGMIIICVYRLQIDL